MKKLILVLFLNIQPLYGNYVLNPETGECAKTDKKYSETVSYLFGKGIICKLIASNSKFKAEHCKDRNGEVFLLLFTVELETCQEISKEEGPWKTESE